MLTTLRVGRSVTWLTVYSAFLLLESEVQEKGDTEVVVSSAQKEQRLSIKKHTLK